MQTPLHVAEVGHLLGLKLRIFALPTLALVARRNSPEALQSKWREVAKHGLGLGATEEISAMQQQ